MLEPKAARARKAAASRIRAIFKRNEGGHNYSSSHKTSARTRPNTRTTPTPKHIPIKPVYALRGRDATYVGGRLQSSTRLGYRTVQA